MDRKTNIVDRAVQNMAKNMITQSKKSKFVGSALIIIGVILLYYGFSDGGALQLTFGFLFLFYGLFRLFHIRQSNVIIQKLQNEVSRLKEINKDAGT